MGSRQRWPRDSEYVGHLAREASMPHNISPSRQFHFPTGITSLPFVSSIWGRDSFVLKSIRVNELKNWFVIYSRLLPSLSFIGLCGKPWICLGSKPVPSFLTVFCTHGPASVWVPTCVGLWSLALAFFPYFSVSYFYDFLKTRLLLKEKNI